MSNKLVGILPGKLLRGKLLPGKLLRGMLLRGLGWMVALNLASGNAFAQSNSVLELSTETISSARLQNLGGAAEPQELLVQFQSKERVIQSDLRDLVCWNSGRDSKPTTCVALEDGSWLAGQILWKSEQVVTIASDWFEKIDVPLTDIRAIILKPSAALRQVRLLQTRMLQLKSNDDVLFKSNSEIVSGVVTLRLKAAVREIENSTQAATLVQWRFKPASGSKTIDIDATELIGVVFSPILRDALDSNSAGPSLALEDGSSLQVRSLQQRPDQTLNITLANGQQLHTLDAAAQFQDAVVAIQGAARNVIWLSDLDPVRYRQLESDEPLAWPLGRNQDLFGNRLFERNQQPLEHSLVVHAPAQVAYRWDGRSANLNATISIQPVEASSESPQRVGSAKCQVMVARDGKLTSAFQSELLRSGDAPVTVSAELADAQLVVLLVDPADMGTYGDHVLWTRPRITVKP